MSKYEDRAMVWGGGPRTTASLVAQFEAVAAEERARIISLLEDAALANDGLARKHPLGPFKEKADTLRRFSQVFLEET
jgi:hypothetical protein